MVFQSSGYRASAFESLTQLLEVGQVPSNVLRDNLPLLKETLEYTFTKRIPSSQHVRVVNDVFSQRTLDQSRSQRMRNQLLHYLSENMADRYTNLTETRLRNEFLDLLAIYVRERWVSSTTYNTFIRDFGDSFDHFHDYQAVKFAQLIVRAGFNQVDIVDAVIEKVLNL